MDPVSELLGPALLGIDGAGEDASEHRTAPPGREVLDGTLTPHDEGLIGQRIATISQ
jgi:hypothetical protein